MNWNEIQIKTTPEAEEAISNFFYEAGAQGVVIESPNDLMILKNNEVLWDYMDDRLINMDPEVSIIKGYIDETKDVSEVVSQIQERISTLSSCGLDPGSVEITVLEVNQEDWANAWKKYYKPTRVGEQFIIKPSWEDYQKKEGDIVIEVDPGMAFGSGLHETTQLCITNLEKYVREGDIVFDIGCGSGILALAAGNLKCKKVIAVDLDSMAVQVAQENIEKNGFSDIIEVREGDLLSVIDEKADIIIANILAEVIIDLTSQVKPYLKEGGLFISSGIILSKVDAVLDQLEKCGFEIVEVEKMGEWAAVIARNK